MSATIVPEAILFDMDGTLTQPLLDFPTIKAEMGIGAQPILEAMAVMTDAERRRAEQVLHRHEADAAMNSTLNPGCTRLLSWLNRHRVKTAIITRNSRRSAQEVVRRHGLAIDVLITRDDGTFKPDPYPLGLACERLGVAAQDAWMVGDGQYDVEAGLAAGTPTVWVSHGRECSLAAQPWRQVRDLVELLELLQHCSPRAKRA